MNITENILAKDLFLIIQNTLIISDIHTGYEESLHKQGYFIPKGNLKELQIRIEKIKKTHHTKTIILNGDLIHSFSKLSIHEKDALKNFIKNIAKDCVLKIIRGNHDKILKFLIPDVQIAEEHIIGNVLITHGDVIHKKSSDKNIQTIIIGHEHPSITIKSGYRSEKYKCFLKGKYFKKDLVVMPSCNLLIEGTDILRDRLLSPYLKNIEDFEVYVIADKIYDFGKVKTIKKKIQ
ncbi:MAG: metallophosphoesterase [Candidatus Woesearchaeota archaeon]